MRVKRRSKSAPHARDAPTPQGSHAISENWERPQASYTADQALPQIYVGICSCRAHAAKRQAVRDTWLANPPPNIDAHFFVGGGSHSIEGEPDTVCLDVPDGYLELPAKVLAFFSHALATTSFDWLFKCDDDTYLALDRLHELAVGRHEIAGNPFLRAWGYASGGAGYLLARKIVERLVALRLPQEGDEDVIIGRAALAGGAKPLVTARLSHNASKWPKRGNRQISAHWCTPDALRTIHAVLRGTPETEYLASAGRWTDRLTLFENGYFARVSTSSGGRWERTAEGNLLLRWDDGRETLLSPTTSGYSHPDLALTETAAAHLASEARTTVPTRQRPKPSSRQNAHLQPNAANSLSSNRNSPPLEDAPPLPDRNIEPPTSDIAGDPQRHSPSPYRFRNPPPELPRILYYSPVGPASNPLLAATLDRFRRASADIFLAEYEDCRTELPADAKIVREKGQKWQLARKHLDPSWVGQYDLIFVWDDDIGVGDFDPLRFVRIMQANRLVMAQPSIRSQYALSHAITAQKPCPLPRGRYHRVGRLTNFVEIMVPVFTREGWREFYSYMDGLTRLGWGLDYVPMARRGIIDCMHVVHTKPCTNYGRHAHREMERLLNIHALAVVPHQESGFLLEDSSGFRDRAHVELQERFTE